METSWSSSCRSAADTFLSALRTDPILWPTPTNWPACSTSSSASRTRTLAPENSDTGPLMKADLASLHAARHFQEPNPSRNAGRTTSGLVVRPLTDLLAKVAFEPGWGHFEFKALDRFF